MTKTRCTLFFITLLFALPIFGQQKTAYALGVNINSRSTFIGGIDFRVEKVNTNGKANRFMLFELVNVKHLNELRVASNFNNVNNNLVNNAFVLGKSNAFYALRGLLGFEKQIFDRADKNGVKLGFNLAGGIALGFVKPYFINYQYKNPDIVKKEAYSSKIHTDYNNVLGSAGLFYGWSNVKIVPGINSRLSFNLEFGENSKYNIFSKSQDIRSSESQ